MHWEERGGKIKTFNLGGKDFERGIEEKNYTEGGLRNLGGKTKNAVEWSSKVLVLVEEPQELNSIVNKKRSALKGVWVGRKKTLEIYHRGREGGRGIGLSATREGGKKQA